jgi:Leucine-rich repeat (LRR) protein
MWWCTDLQGPLPATLPPNLRQLTLWDNNITGPVPDSVADLLDLEVLDLSYNELTGETVLPG